MTQGSPHPWPVPLPHSSELPPKSFFFSPTAQLCFYKFLINHPGKQP